jgi:hypothetical protein
VHEKISNGHLKELCHASGGDCGGTSIDNAFIQMIAKILGEPMITLLKQERYMSNTNTLYNQTVFLFARTMSSYSQ